MKIITIFLAIFLPQILFAQNFDINLKIIDPENKITDSALYNLTTYYNDISLGPKHVYTAKKETKKSATIKDTISTSEIAMLSLRMSSRSASYKIAIDPGASYQITYNLANKEFNVVSNSKSDNLLRYFFKGLDSLRKLKDLRLGLHKQFISVKNEVSADSVLKLVDHFNNDIQRFSKNIAAENPNNIISAYISTKNDSFDLEDQKNYENFSMEVKKSAYGEALKANMDASFSRSKVEEKVQLSEEDLVPISGNSLSGNKILLNQKYFEQNKSKATLIEFWASWCAPCLESLKRIYPFYYLNKSKGFNVILVSLDDDLNQWKKASLRDAYPWLNISDGKGQSSETPKNYKINAIPANILINSDGKIIGRNIFSLETIGQILDR